MISSGMIPSIKFSIIIPVYKVERYLPQCIDSVLKQTFRNFEIILVDDGSLDKCPAICDEYAERDSRISVIHKPNGGLSDARNAGLNIAQGEYVLFLDSDDWWDDCDALKKILDCTLTSNPTVVIFGMKKYFTKDDSFGDIRKPDISQISPTQRGKDDIQAIMQNNIYIACACDKAVRRDFIEKYQLRFVKGQLSEDIEWCCKLLLNAPTIEILSEAFYVYRQQVTTSITSNVGKRNINDILDVITRYADKSSLPLKHFLANQYVLLITTLMRLPRGKRKDFNKQIKSYWWLLDYNWYPYVVKVSMIKFLGYHIVKLLLGFYYKHR